MAASQATCEALWLCKLLVDLFDQQLRPTVIYCDNQSCIQLSENPVFHDRSSTLRSGTISSVTMFREGQLSYSIYPLMSR